MSSDNSSESPKSLESSHPNLALIERLATYIDDFQSGTANEFTYISAMNALQDLHAFVKKTEKVQQHSRLGSAAGNSDNVSSSEVMITIDGEEFFIKENEAERVAVRLTDNYAFNTDTGNFVGVWNYATRSVMEVEGGIFDD
jgi:hypothetical protein